ncbi:MAG TPA: hypothetical protein VFU86_14675, partial [Terriglobales bacterium]|nr:hypothetical protein [Terriglobales bacterium]
PFRVADNSVAVHKKKASQAIVHTFIRRDGHVLVAGWLRSSEYGEVRVHTGILKDTRHESVTVPLPCRAAEITRYDAIGEHSTTSGRLKAELKNVRLTGERVYLAEVQCAN